MSGKSRGSSLQVVRVLPRASGAVVLVVCVALGLAGCSKSHKSATLPPNATTAAGAGGGASSAGGGAPAATATAGAAGSASAGGAGNTLLANGPVCQWLTQAQVTAAAGKPLTDVTGDISGGPQGVLTYHSCLWTPDGGTGSGVSIEVGTWPSGSAQLATQKTTDESNASGLPAPPTFTSVSVGDGGYEVNDTSAHDDKVTFSKGASVVVVDIDHGVAGAALTVANLIEPKV
ncbi:MAG TPA: hypothetical protein VK662_03925 [Acidothermaceae bacterium]|jgi:hypothetical protein|nr:hypothetical protein [Acidothermaceae bacterium]